MLGAGLARKKHQFFGAVALAVDIHHQLETGLFQFPQAEFGHFDIQALLGRDADPRLRQHLCGACLCHSALFLYAHRSHCFPGFG
jgi:hypothetical protein